MHFLHGHTFTGNPILARSALENLKVFEKERVLEKIQPKIERIRARALGLYKNRYVGDVRGKGFMWGIEITRNWKESFPRSALAGWRVALHMWKHGVFVRPLGDTIVINPPLSITDKEIDLIFDVLESSLGVLKKI